MIARYWDDAAFWARMGRGRTTKLRGRQGSRRSTDPMRASIPGVMRLEWQNFGRL